MLILVEYEAPSVLLKYCTLLFQGQNNWWSSLWRRDFSESEKSHLHIDDRHLFRTLLFLNCYVYILPSYLCSGLKCSIKWSAEISEYTNPADIIHKYIFSTNSFIFCWRFEISELTHFFLMIRHHLWRSVDYNFQLVKIVYEDGYVSDLQI